MRQTQIFSGSSHPQLVNNICERLGLQPANAELRKFSNGETSVQIRGLQEMNQLEEESARVTDDYRDVCPQPGCLHHTLRKQ